jgi:RimJ/RimL family protein N-acetyltransferase
VLRKHRRHADWSWRDTVMYAVVDDDWPDVKSGPLDRLEGVA